VMLLPHGFEGQGPEHSSARIERFLQQGAENNMRIVVPSTAGSYFHALRRQVKGPERKPLILFTPKSLLRTKPSYSSTSELLDGSFEPVLSDVRPTSDVRKVVLCSGKIFYDIDKARDERNAEDVALVRIEQLFPFPEEQLTSILATYADGIEVAWAQEEPANMGAMPYIRPLLRGHLGRRIGLISRTASASPATGSNATHHVEQAQLVDEALA